MKLPTGVLNTVTVPGLIVPAFVDLGPLVLLITSIEVAVLVRNQDRVDVLPKIPIGAITGDIHASGIVGRGFDGGGVRNELLKKLNRQTCGVDGFALDDVFLATINRLEAVDLVASEVVCVRPAYKRRASDLWHDVELERKVSVADRDRSLRPSCFHKRWKVGEVGIVEGLIDLVRHHGVELAGSSFEERNASRGEIARNGLICFRGKTEVED